MPRKSFLRILASSFLGLSVIGIPLGLLSCAPRAEISSLARYIPPDAPVALLVRLPVGDGARAWSPLSDILSEEIPGFQMGMAQLWNTPFQGTNVSLKQDVEPWLGSYLAVGFLQVPIGMLGGMESETPPFLLAVEVRDVQAFYAFLDRLRSGLEKAGRPLEESAYGRYTLFALPQRDFYFALCDERVVLLSNHLDTLKAALDRDEQNSLAGNADYRTLIERLPSGGVLQLYISSEFWRKGDQATAGLGEIPSFSGTKAAAFTLLVEPGGLRVSFASLIDWETLAREGLEDLYRAGLSLNPERALSFLPRGSLLIFSGRIPNLLRSWKEISRAFRQVGLPDYAELERGLEELRKKGLDLEEDLLSWMEGEWAFFLILDQEEGVPLGDGLFMRLGLVVETSDVDKARQGMQKVEALLSKEAGVSFSDREISGLTFRVPSVPEEAGPTPGYALVDKFLLFGLDETSLRSFAQARSRPEERLSASEEFQATLRSLPGQRSALVFCNLEDLWKVLTATLPAAERRDAEVWLRVVEHFRGLGIASAAGQPGDKVSTGVLFLHIVR